MKIPMTLVEVPTLKMIDRIGKTNVVYEETLGEVYLKREEWEAAAKIIFTLFSCRVEMLKPWPRDQRVGSLESVRHLDFYGAGEELAWEDEQWFRDAERRGKIVLVGQRGYLYGIYWRIGAGEGAKGRWIIGPPHQKRKQKPGEPPKQGP